MSSPTAKELLAQADRLMRQRTPEELPVLTDLVIDEIEIPSLSDRVDEVIPTHARRSWMPVQPASAAAQPASPPPAVMPVPVAPARAPAVPTTPVAAAAPAPQRTPTADPPVATATIARSPPLAEQNASRPRSSQDAHAAMATLGEPDSQTAMASVRENFNEQLLAKLEELQHGVFSQVMQKLEIHASGSLKTHLRETLEPALIGIVRDLAEQVAEDTATQVRVMVSDAVDAEITRLREQFGKKRL